MKRVPLLMLAVAVLAPFALGAAAAPAAEPAAAPAPAKTDPAAAPAPADPATAPAADPADEPTAEPAAETTDDPEQPAGSPLGIRQDGVREMMKELEHKFSRLADILEENEPEQAARLLKALRESKEALIEKHMADIVALLDEGRLDRARDSQQNVVGN
ncbi:MAG: hypothetical protein ISS74_03440, partial [Planctomycetes bacterium]|nr:hypothetical protein [Planctomycetota bacterium]